MTVRFLLDEHISPRVAAGLKRAGIDAVTAIEAGLGRSDDEALLAAAWTLGRVVVTYNTADFAPLLASRNAAGAHGPGIVFVSAKPLAPDLVGALVKSLACLAEKIHNGEVDVSCGVFLERK
ncbi:MAG: hypothetical protein FD180_1292 [Planctomycetota bacterium]|nr:MAG: hypothetical protein FD180_1292 [Planctomycetota bacterium]